MAPGLSPTELLSALTILQNQSMSMQSHGDSVADAAQAVQALKQELLEQVHKLSGETKPHHVSSADEDTIDLVGMLFEFILQDRNLPAQIQALLGRLQIPYLKVAILDKHLFAQKTHPARRLLDALADAGKSWSEESDKDHRLQDRIRQVVEAILSDFDDDVAIFERELENFAGFMEQYHRRAEIAEQRAAEATRGREKLQDARRTAAREILQRIEERNLPPVVHAVLSRPWANYLVLTLLRQGENSDEWKSALRFADEFVWSALPKTNDLERTRLRALLPQLEKALRHGLATVAYHDNDVKQLMHELSQFYQRLLDGEKVEVKTAKEVIAAGAASAIPAAVQPQHEAAAGAGTTETVAPVIAPATQSPVEEIVLNTHDRGNVTRGKLLRGRRVPEVRARDQGRHLARIRRRAGQPRAREAVVDQPDQPQVPLRQPSRPQGLRQDRVRARDRAAPRLDDRARRSAAVRSCARCDRRAPAHRAGRSGRSRGAEARDDLSRSDLTRSNTELPMHAAACRILGGPVAAGCPSDESRSDRIARARGDRARRATCARRGHRQRRRHRRPAGAAAPSHARA